MDKLVCVGKNYLDHARELGDAVPELPVLFLKPPSIALFGSAGGLLQVPFPEGRGALHHECEIVLRLGTDRKSVDAVTLGLDMTLRDEQARLKKAGHPWEMSKVFPGSALLGPWIPVGAFADFLDTPFSFWLDGKLRQEGLGRQMRLPPDRCVEYAAGYFPLHEGDAIFTGTPAGVGPVQPGQAGELKWGSRLKVSIRWRATGG